MCINFDPKIIIILVGYPKDILYTKFEHFGIFRFRVIVWTDRHTNRQKDAAKRFTRATIVGVSNHSTAILSAFRPSRLSSF